MNKKKPQKLVTNRGVSRTGTKSYIDDKNLYDKIRKRLNLSKDELSDKDIVKVITESNRLIGSWIVDHPEGFLLQIGFDKKNPMGVLAASKHLPKEFRGDNDETLANIATIPVNDTFRKQLIKRYNVDVGHAIDYKKLEELGQLIPHLNLSTYFYKYRILWFNHRNCVSKKAVAYTFVPNRHKVNKKLHENILSGKDYYEWNFSDFFIRKVKAAI